MSVDDRELKLSYRFEEAPLALDNHVVTVKLVGVTGQAITLVNGSAHFDLQEPNSAEHYQALIHTLIVDGPKGCSHC
ncbi:MAG: hypothetical protein M3Q94_11800 [Pseudomonadota bacterium]|nr:hypothetical protein [Pseudomonadota bacterium]